MSVSVSTTGGTSVSVSVSGGTTTSFTTSTSTISVTSDTPSQVSVSNKGPKETRVKLALLVLLVPLAPQDPHLQLVWLAHTNTMRQVTVKASQTQLAGSKQPHSLLMKLLI